MKPAIGLNKIFKDQDLLIEGPITEVMSTDPLPLIAARGNPAAHNAIFREKYTVADEPFYYCKMGNLGFVIAEKDFKYVAD